MAHCTNVLFLSNEEEEEEEEMGGRGGEGDGRKRRRRFNSSEGESRTEYELPILLIGSAVVTSSYETASEDMVLLPVSETTVGSGDVPSVKQGQCKYISWHTVTMFLYLDGGEEGFVLKKQR